MEANNVPCSKGTPSGPGGPDTMVPPALVVGDDEDFGALLASIEPQRVPGGPVLKGRLIRARRVA